MPVAAKKKQLVVLLLLSAAAAAAGDDAVDIVNVCETELSLVYTGKLSLIRFRGITNRLRITLLRSVVARVLSSVASSSSPSEIISQHYSSTIMLWLLSLAV